MSRRSAIVLGAFSVVAGLASETLRQVWLQPIWVSLTDFAIGQLLVWCGLIAAVARPSQPAGRRLALAGLLWIVAAPRQWFGGQGITDDFMQLDAISFTLVGWSDVVLAFIALTFAERWPKGRYKAMVVALVLVFGLQTLIRIAARADVLFGLSIPDAVFPLVAYADISRIVAIAFAGVLIAHRWLKASPPSRYFLGPVLGAGVAAALAPLYALWYPIAALGWMDPIAEDIAIPGFWITNAVRALVPVAMLFGILRQRRSRSSIADAIANVGDAPSSVALQLALSQALADPSLRVATWDEPSSRYVDENGTPVVTPGPDSPLVATPVTGKDGNLAVLIHDRALEEDRALVYAGVAVTRLVTENERLTRTREGQLAEVRASRARIVEAGDAERRRIERDLHDGVQQRLLALALSLRRAADAAQDDRAAAEALETGAAEALGVVADVRELARGIHPAVLSEAGLAAALQALADRSPVPVDVDLKLDGTLKSSVSATAYYVASEALANVVKHSNATVAHLSAVEVDGRIEMSVEDDGQGGADADGAGLRGLSDRLSALGGVLHIRDRAGGGTIVSATIPLSAQ